LSVATWLFSGFQLQRDMGKLLVFIFAGNMVAALALLPAIARFLLTERKQAGGNTPLMPSRR
jgi:predicted RND superfamily exporter protein